MALLLLGHHHRTVSRMLLVHLLIVVTQVFTFSWHGAYKSVPASRSDSYSGWQPETFWWRNRRRNSSPTVKAQVPVEVVLSGRGSHQPAASKEPKSRGILPELNNHITKMGQPAFPGQRVHNGRLGWGFLRPANKQESRVVEELPPLSPHYVSFHYSTPAFNSLSSMNRRDKLHNMRDELDQEVMKNVISQALEEERHPPVRPRVKTVGSQAATHPIVKVHESSTPAPTEQKLAPHRVVPLPTAVKSVNTVARPTARSSILGSSQQKFSTSSGFDDGFSSMQADSSLSDFPSLGSSGFESFVDPGNSEGGFSAGGFGDPLMIEVRPKGSLRNGQGSNLQGASGHFADHTNLGFGSFEGADTHVGDFGWREPESQDQGQRFESVGFQPIPTAAAAASLGSFSQDDKDCDTILTKTCTGDSDCVCYGFYYCSAGKCEDITSSSPSKG